jgi:hypothetical protein
LVCIIDDLSKCTLNKKATNNLIKSINSIFSNSIFITEESFRLIVPDFSELDEYQKLEILPFGNVRRTELIEKWVALGLTEEAEDQKFYEKIDDLSLHVNSLVRKNVVPSKPIYILMLLQSFETITPQRLELTSYGHCYQNLIYQALERAHVKQVDIDMYINVLTELGGAILDSSSESIDEFNLNIFFENYLINYLPINRSQVIMDLVGSSILMYSETGLRFRYRYIFYFFASKKLADSLHKGKESKEKIQSLVDKIHLEKASNIVLFFTHHSKDPWILDQILYSVMSIFNDEKEATLEANSLLFLQDFVKEIPELVIENR